MAQHRLGRDDAVETLIHIPSPAKIRRTVSARAGAKQGGSPDPRALPAASAIRVTDR